MNKSLVAAVVTFVVLTASGARAEAPRGEVSALVGYGTAAFDASDNNFGFGAGLRAGVTFGHLWIGAAATYQLGNPQHIDYLDESGHSVAGNSGLSTFSGGGELGLSFRVLRSNVGSLVIRPFAYVGTNIYVPSPLDTYVAVTQVRDPIVRFVVAPSLHIDYELARSGVFFGVDARVSLLPPGNAPHVFTDNWEFPARGWYYTESFTAQLSVFATVGKRF